MRGVTSRATQSRDAANTQADGLYDRLVNAELQSVIDGLGDARAPTQHVNPEESHALLAKHLESIMSAALASARGSENSAMQLEIAERVLSTLKKELGPESLSRAYLKPPLRTLQAIDALGSGRFSLRPDTPLAQSALLTGSRRDPSLSSQLDKEIRTADRVDILCSFIKWTGLRLLLPALRQLTESPHPDGPRLRVLTTSYLGATDAGAVQQLLDLPNTTVKVAYDTKRTRLHAKAYLMHRASGFGSAYVGSANLSEAALTEGLEWITKLSQAELRYLWDKAVATFDQHWGDREFDLLSPTTFGRFEDAIQRERGSSAAGAHGAVAVSFDLRPFPFQEDILEVLAAERELQKTSRQLIVAATGTGKTMIAAFDYLRFAETRSDGAPLLFIAHREEILQQALSTFRAVVRDQNFGRLLVGRHDGGQSPHLFCSIQSYCSRELWNVDAKQFSYVVVDEFHHAAAPSYRRLLEHVQPEILLGLTATPERADGFDILHWFGGRASAEIRLADAISRRLLCPFQYFGISDCVDVNTMHWTRGGYSVEELNAAYVDNTTRARLILQKLQELVLDPRAIRGLGFCVSVAHANFMAQFMNENGVPSLALSAESPDAERLSAQQRLRRREINLVFVVDLYNEGVDIPEVDTVLFLRPTESLTVFLQQLGRGLRLHRGKDTLTVLDFIGQQRREFRFAPRFRAMSADPSRGIEDEIAGGFQHLPPGCSIQLERVAQERVFENLRASSVTRRARLVTELKELARALGRTPRIGEALDFLGIDLDALLKHGLWSRLLFDAGLGSPVNDPDSARLTKGVHRLSHFDDPSSIRSLLSSLMAPDTMPPPSSLDYIRLAMLHTTLWGETSRAWSLADAVNALRRNPAAHADTIALLEQRLRDSRIRSYPIDSRLAGPLAIHARYTRDEILVGLGHWDLNHRPDMREGAVHLGDKKVDAFFVTLNKSPGSYSRTTMYEDYVIDSRLFHWQSQSTKSSTSPTGVRYRDHASMGYTPLLFVREEASLPSGLAAPYIFLGPAEYVSSEGSRPISIIWRLQVPIPASLAA